MNDLLIGIRSGKNELNCNRIICLSYLATYINVAGKHGSQSQQTRVFILLWLIMPDCLHRRLPSQAVHDQCQICQKSGGGGSRVDETRVGRIRPARRPTYDFFNVRRNPRPRGGGIFSLSPLIPPLDRALPPSSSSPCVDVLPLSNTFSLVYNGSYIVFTGWGHSPMSTPLATPL